MESIDTTPDHGINRREFLGVGAKILLATSLGGSIGSCAISDEPETSTRIYVPEGFTPRIVARSGFPSTAASEYEWHSSPDGGACFATGDGGWIYVSNSEDRLNGGVGVLRFDANGTVVDSYSILDGTIKNCAGGSTPRQSWLSCEEVSSGRVWECDPLNEYIARAQPALGVFKHESAAVDPLTWQIYLTEDESDGCLYRFTPAGPVSALAPDLLQGSLQAAQSIGDFVNWLDIPDPLALKTPLRYQVPAATRFRGGEGIDIYDRLLRFTTKFDNRIWKLNLLDDRLEAEHNLSGQVNDVDDITHTQNGDYLVAEDGHLMRIMYFPEDGSPAYAILRLPEHRDSEITGLAFDPAGSRLYFSSQRGNTGKGINGISFELTGDFSTLAPDLQPVEWNLDHAALAI